MIDGINRRRKTAPFKIVLIYVVVGSIYIFCSDYLLKKFVSDIRLLSELQTYKGLGFIFITSLLLFFLIYQNTRTITKFYHNLRHQARKANEEQERHEQKYWELFNHTPLPLWIFDAETYQFLLANDTACRAYGYTREEYMKMTIRDIRPPEDVPALEKILKETIRNKSNIYSSLFRHRKKNGEIIFVKIENREIIFEDRVARLVLATDVTDSIEKIKKIEKQNERLRDIAWMQSHVVRAPLANLIGLVHILKEGGDTHNYDAELVNNIIDAADKLDHVIRAIVEKSETVEAVA